MIEVKNLKKYYGEIKAVDDISFSVDTGEVLGFLGPNGAGKSTTMNIITGYISSTSGTVTVDGSEPVNVRSWDHVVRSFHKMQAALCIKGLDPAVPHHAEIVVSHQYTDDENPVSYVRIGAILTA